MAVLKISLKNAQKGLILFFGTEDRQCSRKVEVGTAPGVVVSLLYSFISI